VFARQGGERARSYRAERDRSEGPRVISPGDGPRPTKSARKFHAALAAGASQMGPLMKALRDKFGPSLDGKVASELAKRSAREKIAPA